MAHRPGKFRLMSLALIALLPSFLKRGCYRAFFGYKIGKRVKIGVSILDASICSIDDNTQIGHLNVVIGVERLTIGDHTKIGHLNIFRGGDEITLGRYCEIIRLNEINSIPDPLVVNPIDPRFILGNGSIVTTGHKIDFTDKVEIGTRTIIGGRNSSIWTHNRQRTRGVNIGSYAYIGSEIRVAPGGGLPSRCIVGIGTVITKPIETENCMIAGVPAKVVKMLSDDDLFLVEQKTRPDLPDEIV